MNGWILISVVLSILLSILAFGSCWFDYQEIKWLKETLINKAMDIYNLERRIETLEHNIVRLSTILDEHDSRIREFEGDSYEE